MKTENKQYKLNRWYPSLHSEWKHEEITVEKTKDGNYVNFMDCQVVPKHEVENNPDFWELIEEEKPKPLFVTEDGVEVFSDIDNLFAINVTYFSKTQNTLRSSRWLIDNPSYKVFSIESNADEYIWRNKWLFSYEELIMFDSIKAEDDRTNELKRIAKERSER